MPLEQEGIRIMFGFDRHKDVSAENIKALQDYNKLEPDNTWDFKLWKCS